MIKPILDFLEATEIDRRPKETEEKNMANKQLDEWNLDRLEREEAESKKEDEERGKIIHTRG